MVRCSLLSLLCGLALASLSGCCVWCPLFCHSCGSYYERHGLGGHRGHGSCVGGSCGSYGACVTPAGCPGCATGIYSVQVDPVQRARAARLERLRRQRSGACVSGAGGPRRRHPAARSVDPLAYGGDYLLDPGGYDGLLDYGDELFVDEFDGYGLDPLAMEFDAGDAPCNCGPQGMQTFTGGLQPHDWESQGWTASEWVEVDPQPHATYGGSPQPHLIPLPNALPQTNPVPQPYAPPAAPPTTPPTASPPMNDVTPEPMPAAGLPREQYYLPGAVPAASPATTSLQSTSGLPATGGVGSGPVQPVLWVPPVL